ncbi:hypothetical protein BU17DRAFT_93860 [Hysterangium stoloniferum]|nr:hypothetical protein BU17DRAFT_93860 [Hysterangium stoloniferum]
MQVRLQLTDADSSAARDNTAIDANRNDIDRGDVNGRVDVNMNVGRRDVNVQRRNMRDAMSRKSLPRCQEEIRVNANANPNGANRVHDNPLDHDPAAFAAAANIKSPPPDPNAPSPPKGGEMGTVLNGTLLLLVLKAMETFMLLPLLVSAWRFGAGADSDLELKVFASDSESAAAAKHTGLIWDLHPKMVAVPAENPEATMELIRQWSTFTPNIAEVAWEAGSCLVHFPMDSGISMLDFNISKQFPFTTSKIDPSCGDFSRSFMDTICFETPTERATSLSTWLTSAGSTSFGLGVVVDDH